MHFSFGIFMAVLDVALNIYERYIEIKLLIEYHECGDTAWMWLTIACILLPAVISAVAFTVWALKEKEWGWVAIAMLMLIFPVSSLIW